MRSKGSYIYYMGMLYIKTWGCFIQKHGDVLYQNMGVFYIKTWGCFYTKAITKVYHCPNNSK